MYPGYVGGEKRFSHPMLPGYEAKVHMYIQHVTVMQ